MNFDRYMTGDDWEYVAPIMGRRARRRAGRHLVALVYFRNSWVPIVAGGADNPELAPGPPANDRTDMLARERQRNEVMSGERGEEWLTLQ